jgi:MraZ protein
MAMFLFTYVNGVDKKARVSIPATFRAPLSHGEGRPATVFLWPSMNHGALEGADSAYMETLSDSLESPDLDQAERDYIETFVFGKAVELTLDPEGRVVLPKNLAEFAGITDQAAFIGRRKTFQVWEPSALEAHEAALRGEAASRGISLSSVVAKAQRGRGGAA